MDKKKMKEGTPLKIVGNFVFETGGRIDLPLHKLLLKPIAGNLTQSLNIRIQIQKGETKKELKKKQK